MIRHLDKINEARFVDKINEARFAFAGSILNTKAWTRTLWARARALNIFARWNEFARRRRTIFLSSVSCPFRANRPLVLLITGDIYLDYLQAFAVCIPREQRSIRTKAGHRFWWAFASPPPLLLCRTRRTIPAFLITDKKVETWSVIFFKTPTRRARCLVELIRIRDRATSRRIC